MTALLQFTVQSDEFVLGEALDVDAATYIELTQFVPVGEALIPYFWADTEDDDAVASAVRASEYVESVDKLNGATGRSLFQVRWKPGVDGLLDALETHDLAVQRAICSEGSWRFELIAEDRETFAEFQSTCKEKGLDLTVTRLSDSIARDSALYGLTDKQRNALLEAYEAGYYDVNRTVRLGEISEELEISQQALGALLRRGTGSLIEHTIAVEHSV
ncbi:helix-turn-helix domain-containing protein [Halogeometricum luteum]|uniref:Helix-turn-helix domain-containing protein n=1 Tax=Halogeometricum luteum TaxID=2950537 RepID=A0ABU2G7B2_9EURY|nr:helix-turn-helix domain-containing protein [Halogeometricum sp. S3BR5-2]MDS0296124.1 helix-turn-helix domain-containing protein [Halogeometricum sp. S3BR5-2]